MANLRQVIKEASKKAVKATLNEAAMEGFSLEELTAIPSLKGKLRYCQQFLGTPVGKGTARIVFQIDDEKVLKLALNQKGIAQNEVEGQNDWFKIQYSIFPTVFEKDDKDWAWIVSEFVLPAKRSDFKHVLGMPFEDFTWFLRRLALWHRPQNRGLIYGMPDEQAQALIDNNQICQEINDYLSNYTNVPIGDLTKLANYGLAVRGGEPYIVILDSGLDDTVYDKYYRVKRKQ